MESRNFVVTVKERQADEPCFLLFETVGDIGLGKKSVVLDTAEGTNFEAASALARAINAGAIKIRLLG